MVGLIKPQQYKGTVKELLENEIEQMEINFKHKGLHEL